MNIVISGTVGVGKSTISKKLEEYFLKNNKETYLIEEILENNPYLDNYYKNRPEWSFLIQMDFVFDRFNKAYLNCKKGSSFNIFDRHFLDDYIFSNMPTIKDDMSNLLWNSYAIFNNELALRLKETCKIDFFFLLKADFDEIVKRISTRGRESEKNVNVDYWKSLYYQYYENKEIETYIRNNVNNFVIIDANNNDTEKIISKIISYIKKIH